MKVLAVCLSIFLLLVPANALSKSSKVSQEGKSSTVGVKWTPRNAFELRVTQIFEGAVGLLLTPLEMIGFVGGNTGMPGIEYFPAGGRDPMLILALKVIFQ